MLEAGSGLEVAACRGHTGAVIRVIGLGHGFEGQMFASSSQDWTIRVWTDDGRAVRVVEAMDSAISLATCGPCVAAGFSRGDIWLYDALYDWDVVWAVNSFSSASSVSLDPNGRFLAIGSADEPPAIISSIDGSTLQTLDSSSISASVLGFTSGGTRVLLSAKGKNILAWRVFFKAERRVRALLSGLSVLDWEMRELCREVVERMKRLHSLD